MNDYHFSLFGAMVGFLIVLIINIKLKKEKLIQYIDGVVLSFLFILSLGFIGAFLGGQVYGRETLLGIEIMYTHPFTSVPFQVPIFPLPIVYSILFFILFSLLYILSVFIKIKGFLGYIGLIAFGSILLIFECFSGKYDILKDATSVNFPQIFSIILILTASYQLAKILKEKSTQAVPVQKKPKEKKNDIKK